MKIRWAKGSILFLVYAFLFTLLARSHAREERRGAEDPSELLKQPTRCDTVGVHSECDKDSWEGNTLSRQHLPLCHTGTGANHSDDMVGEWITLPPLPSKENGLQKPMFATEAFMMNNLTSPIYGNDLAQGAWALSMYRRMWIPSQCRYHRFTQASLMHYLRQRHSMHNDLQQPASTHSTPQKKTMTNVAFFGDSVLRGVYCGINRIITGDEIFGPNIDAVCGGTISAGKRGRAIPLTFSSEGKVTQGVSIPRLFNTSFTYVRYMNNLVNVSSPFFSSITQRGTLDSIKMVIDQTAANISTKLDAIVVSSGPWDFHVPHIRAENGGRGHCTRPYTNATAGCFDDFHSRQAKIRDNDTMEFIRELSSVCRKQNIQLIYKNNHYNCRFGAQCADEELEKTMVFPGSQWQVWDTRNVSMQHWRDQTWDGLHFDRQIAHSIKDHLLTWWEARFRFKGAVIYFPHQAELEIQLAQSLLNRIIMPGLKP